MKQPVRLRPAVDGDSDLLFESINDHDLMVSNAPFCEISRAGDKTWFACIRTRIDLAFVTNEHVDTSLAIGAYQLLSIHPTHRSAELQIRIARSSFRNQGGGPGSAEIDQVRVLTTRLAPHFTSCNCDEPPRSMFRHADLSRAGMWPSSGISRPRKGSCLPRSTLTCRHASCSPAGHGGIPHTEAGESAQGHGPVWMNPARESASP